MRKTIRDGFIIFGTTFLIFVSCEVILRMVYPEKIKTHPEQHMSERSAYEFNEEYIVSLKPNIKKTFTRSQINGGNRIEWRTNKNSFRGHELREQQDLRIMIYGDSNIQARFSDLEDTFPYKLEKYLREIVGRDIEVINAGVVGFGPDQSLIRFTQEADTYNPDIVIFHINSDNDFGDIIRNRLFELDSSDNLATPGYRTKLIAFLSSLSVTKAAHKMARIIRKEDRKEDEKHDRGKTLSKLLDVTEREFAVHSQQKPRTFPHFADHYDIDIALYPQSESATTKMKFMSAVLNRARQFADSKNIRFMVMIQPSSKDLTTNLEPNFQDFLKYPGYRRSMLTSVVENICTENNIPSVNLFDIFLQHDPQTLFFKDHDHHWNDRGQDISAQETAYYISEHILSE
jgi:hypothetical protein